MKLVRTLLHTSDLDRVVAALEREGFHGMTIAETVHCDSRPSGPPRVTYRNEVTVATHADRVDRLLRALHSAGCKRELEVTLEPLTGAVRIRTGEVDEAAIWQ